MDDRIEGQLLHGRYQVQRHLAKKAARQVLLACDLETQELVVVKLLLFGREFEWQDYKLFERGAQALQALSHPAIPCYRDHFDLDLPELKGFALVQSYIEANSLQEHLKAGRTFSEIEVKQLAKALLEILMYLHERQPPVIHRDIKPSNILLGDRSGNSVGQVCLVDFDSVQTVTTEVGTRTIVGTYGYMPPEQFGGRAVPASDLYGLGATLIYLVTGRDPADLPQIDLQIQFEQAANLSPALTSWLKWMTLPSLDKRLSSAQQALQALSQPHIELKDIVHINSARPESSRILLHKDANELEIFIPASGLLAERQRLGKNLSSLGKDMIGFIVGGTLLTVTVWAILTVVIEDLRSGFSSDLFMVMSHSLGLLYMTLCMGLPSWFISWFFMNPFLSLFTQSGRSTRLCLNRQKIYLTHKTWFFGGTRTAKRQDITKLLVRVISTKMTGGSLKIITLKGRKQIFNIDHPTLSDAELHWLTDELSQWLNLPITKA